MRTALAAANAHILQLTAQQQQQASCSLQDPPQQLHASTTCQHSTAGPLTDTQCSTHDAGHDACAAGPNPDARTPHTANSQASEPYACSAAASAHEDVLQDLQQQVAVRQQQLDQANEQIKDLVQHLALKHDAVQFAENRAAMLQHQVC